MALYGIAKTWVKSRILRPNNLLHLVKFLMLETAKVHPEASGHEKKSLVLGVFEDLLNDSQIEPFIRNKKAIELAYEKLIGSWIDTGIKAHKQRFLFNLPDEDAPTEISVDVVKRIADVAEEWFKDKVVTASNVILGITAVMQAAGQFFKGDGEMKRDMVLRAISEIVHREGTNLLPEDRDAILTNIDTFGTPVVDFLVDLASGQFDFKGFVEKIKDMCMPLSSCCKKKKPITEVDAAAL